MVGALVRGGLRLTVSACIDRVKAPLHQASQASAQESTPRVAQFCVDDASNRANRELVGLGVLFDQALATGPLHGRECLGSATGSKCN